MFKITSTRLPVQGVVPDLLWEALERHLIELLSLTRRVLQIVFMLRVLLGSTHLFHMGDGVLEEPAQLILEAQV